MNNKYRILILSVILVVILAIGVYLLNTNKPKADTITAINNSIAGLRLISAKDNSSIIKLSEKFTDNQIGAALLNPVAKTRSNQDEEILKDARQKAKDFANQTVKSQKRSTTVVPPKKMVEGIVIDVRNSQGKRVELPKKRAAIAAPATVADNFDFDTTISSSAKQLLIEVYPKIEEIYGARSNNGKIKVLRDSDLLRSYFLPGLNEMHISNDLAEINEKSRLVYIHELVHAFHNDFCLASIWEEGIAQTISYYISRSSYAATYTDDGGAYNYEFKNNPLDDFPERANASDYSTPYEFGQVVFDKILIENKGFFKIFNQQLYKEDANTIWLNYSRLIELASQVLPKIENQSTSEWFARQVAFLPVNENYLNPSFVRFNNAFYVLDGYVGFFSDNLPSNTKSLNIKGYGNANELKVECDASDLNLYKYEGSYTSIEFSSCLKPLEDAKYEGAVKFVVTANNDSSKSTSEYALISPRSQSSSVSGLVKSTNNPTSVKLTNVDSNWSTTATIKDGAFYIDDTSSKVAGRFKVDLLGAGDKVLKTQYFNKFNSNYQVLMLDTPNNCSLKTMKAKGISSGIDIAADFSSSCFNTLFINSVPIERSLTNLYKTLINGLEANKSYGLFMSSTNGGGYTSKSNNQLVTTQDLFKIVKEENVGVASQGNYARRITFNYPMDTESSSSVFKEKNGNFVTYTEIKKVNDLTYDFVPLDKILDNHEYVLEHTAGKSVDGSLLNGMWISSSIFTTPKLETVKYKITTSASAGGIVSPNGVVDVISGTDQTFSFTPNTGYKFDYATIDGVVTKLDSNLKYTFVNVNANHSLAVVFETVKYTIKATTTTGGAVTPLGISILSGGQGRSFNITPNTGYKITDVLVDGKSVGAVNTYAFTNLTANHTISASFAVVLPATASGLVTNSGKVVSGANIGIIKNGTSVVSKTLVANSSGAYSVTGLSAGNYSATASARICTKYWFYTACSNKSKTVNFSLIEGKNTVIPTIKF